MPRPRKDDPMERMAEGRGSAAFADQQRRDREREARRKAEEAERKAREAEERG